MRWLCCGPRRGADGAYLAPSGPTWPEECVSGRQPSLKVRDRRSVKGFTK